MGVSYNYICCFSFRQCFLYNVPQKFQTQALNFNFVQTGGYLIVFSVHTQGVMTYASVSFLKTKVL